MGRKKQDPDRENQNVTVTMEPTVLRWAKVRAAEDGSSLTQFLGRLLKERMDLEASYEVAMMRYLGRLPRALRQPGDRLPERGDLP